MAGRSVVVYNDELYHFGIKGQKWGERNYQNEDGTLTEEGKLRYRKSKRLFGIYDRNATGEASKISRQARGEQRREEARKMVKMYGGKNAAKAEVQDAYSRAGWKNALKGGIASAAAVGGFFATGILTSSIGAALVGGLPGAVVAAGSVFANAALAKNAALSNAYINDINVEKEKIKISR